MDTLVEQGTVVIGGPLGDDVDTGEVLLVPSADDEAAVCAALASDPWRDNMLIIKDVRRWSLGWAQWLSEDRSTIPCGQQ